MGFANEIVHPEVAGDDLIDAIVILMNRIKKERNLSLNNGSMQCNFNI